MTVEPWVSVEEIAANLGVTKDSVYRWLHRKGLPAHKVGRLWKFKLSPIDAWIESGGAGASSATKDGDDP